MGGALTLGKGIVNMIKGSQGNLFPKGSKANPYSKNPSARARDNKALSERGAPDMPLD